ncbi:MAG: hypothetical protein KKH83_02930 [Candidatus Margulisbacteria bacterium]|nr:hypothetical protein [Candidatus Margulisiibacteriota bacterium]
MSIDLVGLLYLALVIFVITLIVAMVYVIMILVDIRRSTRGVGELIERLKALTFFLKTLVAMTKGADEAKNEIYKNILPSRATTVSFFAGLKEGLDVLMGGDEDDQEND